MRTAPLHVALLGCGRIARLYHLGLLARLPGVALDVVADPDPAARTVVRKAAPDAAVLADWREALGDSAIEAVVITLPNDLHAEAACAAFEAGKHVYLEKPTATSLHDGERVVDAWRASGRLGMIGFHGRFDPVVLGLRRAIAEGRIGRVVAARIAIGAASRDLPAWKRARATGGGALLDLGSHAIDLSRFLFNREVAAVSGTVRSHRSEDDTAACAVALEDGTVVQVFVCLAGIQENVIEIVGERGVLTGDRYDGTIRIRPVRPPYGRPAHLRREIARLAAVAKGVRTVVAPPDHAIAYRRALAAFARAAAGGVPATPDLEDGQRSLTAILAIEAAAGEAARAATAACES